MKNIIALLLAVGSFVGPTANAQYSTPPRTEDHMWRRRVLTRFDLKDKVNAALDQGQYLWNYTVNDSKFRYQKGIVDALLYGYERLKFMGYNPDFLDVPLKFKQFMEQMKTLVYIPQVSQDGDLLPEDFGVEEGEELFDTNDDFGFDDFDLGMDDGAPSTSQDDAESKEAEVDYLEAIRPGMKYTIELIEDELFDKNKSSRYFQKLYIRLIFVSDIEGLGTQAVVAFRYTDIEHILANMLWSNRNNDAQELSVQDMFEKRVFSGNVLNLSAAEVYNLAEAAKRRKQLVAFEHHLWSY